MQGLPNIPARAAGRVAYFASAANLAAAAAMWLLLRRGLPVAGSDPLERMRYLRSHTSWQSGWLLWHVAAIGLLAFFVVLALRWAHRAPIRSLLALTCAAAGLAADLAAEGLWMRLAPASGERDLLLVEAAAGILTGYVGNGLYTVAGILLTWAGAGELPRRASPPLSSLVGIRPFSERVHLECLGGRTVLGHRFADAALRCLELPRRPVAIPPRILIPGGYGVFGRLLAREILAVTQARLVIAGRNARAAREACRDLDGADRCEALELDLNDLDAVRAAAGGCFAVACAAVLPGIVA